MTPGPRPEVVVSEADGVESPGAGPPVLFGPLVAEPGVDEVPAPLCPPVLIEPLVPPELPADDPPALPPLEPPPEPPPLWANASVVERASIVAIVVSRFMGNLLLRQLTQRLTERSSESQFLHIRMCFYLPRGSCEKASEYLHLGAALRAAVSGGFLPCTVCGLFGPRFDLGYSPVSTLRAAFAHRSQTLYFFVSQMFNADEEVLCGTHTDQLI